MVAEFKKLVLGKNFSRLSRLSKTELDCTGQSQIAPQSTRLPEVPRPLSSEGKKDPIMSTNGDLYLNTKNQTLWYNYKKKKQNNWKELKNEKKIILDNSIKLGIDKFIKIIFGYEEKLPGLCLIHYI